MRRNILSFFEKAEAEAVVRVHLLIIMNKNIWKVENTSLHEMSSQSI